MNLGSLTILAAHPFFQAYFQSDFFGRLIFWMLFVMSVGSWIVVIHKWRQLQVVSDLAQQVQSRFKQHGSEPLGLDFPAAQAGEFGSPFQELYRVLRKHTVDVLSKNRQEGNKDSHYLSPSDISFVEANLMSAVSTQTKNLQKNLFVLSTIVSLAPFMGLLGTVWGILLTFTEMQAHSSGGSQMVLGGLSMALGTTVIGLIVAIPALVGYNYLSQWIQDYVVEMEDFCNEMLAAIEMQYRKVDVT